MKKQLNFFAGQMRKLVTEMPNLSQSQLPSLIMKHVKTFLNNRPKLIFSFLGNDFRGFHTTRTPLHLSSTATARLV